MTAISDYLEQALLNATLRNVAYTSPATVYVALYTAAPSDSGGGTEVTGGSYARQAATFGAPAVSGTGYACANTGAITFASMPAATVTHAAILSASTGGNLMYHGALTASKVVGAGDSFVIAIGSLVVSLT